MNTTHAPHYHIRWLGKLTLDWERFDTSAQAEKSAKELVRPYESYTIEEHDGACPRCREAMDLKMDHGAAKKAAS